MSVSITLPNDLEQFLQSHAQRVGIPVETLLARTIVERWDSVRRVPPLEDRESDLRLRLQTLFPAEQTQEYQDLCRQSDAGTRSRSRIASGSFRSLNSATIKTPNASKSLPSSLLCAVSPFAR